MAWKPQSPSPPHPANQPGDFYVEDGCCITCGTPLAEAPEVFGWAKDKCGKTSQCVVVNQPETPASIDRTLAAMWAGEVQCIRYRGNDSDIGRRLVEADLGEQCDQAPPSDAVPLVRSHVTFRAAGAADIDSTQLAQDFLRHFKMRQEVHRAGFDGNALLLESTGNEATVKIAWVTGSFHMVTFREFEAQSWLAVARPEFAGAGIGLSRIVDSWLRSEELCQDIRWFSAEQWRAGGPSRSTVI